MHPIALTIAGSDPSGGAGLQADLKTFTALGVYGASVVTALTAQNTRGVIGAISVPPDFIALQIEAVVTDLKVTAAKTGMLGDTPTVMAVAAEIRRQKIHPLVVDPVMVATSGDVLLAPDAIDTVRRELIPLAEIITPNCQRRQSCSAKPLLPMRPRCVRRRSGCWHLAARPFWSRAGTAVVPRPSTFSPLPARCVRLARPRIATSNTHGTGCTLAAAITAHLARGCRLLRP